MCGVGALLLSQGKAADTLVHPSMGEFLHHKEDPSEKGDGEEAGAPSGSRANIDLVAKDVSWLPSIDEVGGAIAARGPDSLRYHKVGHASFVSSTLFMRGPPTPQPLVSGDGDVLCFNGEVFGGLDLGGANDTTAVFHELLKADGTAERIVTFLGTIRGPYALIFYHARSNTLFFGKDKIGRRSMLVYASAGGLCVSSAAVPAAEGRWFEVPPMGIYSLDMSTFMMTLHEWQPCADVAEPALPLEERHGQPPPTVDDNPIDEHALESLTSTFRKAVGVRVQDVPAPFPGACVHQNMTQSRVAVLFSGGIDSMLLAAVVDEAVPPGGMIDLINVSFGAPPFRTPDRLSGLSGFVELSERASQRLGERTVRWNMILVDVTADDVDRHKDHIMCRLEPEATIMDFTIGSALWFAARGEGMLCSVEEARGQLEVNSAKVAQAERDDAAATKEQKREIQREQRRAVKREKWERKQAILRGEIDPDEDLKARTAASVDGPPSWTCQCGNTFVKDRVKSGARVLLSGLGADEQFAGYKGRHRNRFSKFGWSVLERELRTDVRRLWLRNLGRDDRVISDSGREVRFPFLDEGVLELSHSLPVWVVADLRMGDGIGDKRLLREVARRMGLTTSVTVVKRAIQFGSKSAKYFKTGSMGTKDLHTAEPTRFRCVNTL